MKRFLLPLIINLVLFVVSARAHNVDGVYVTNNGDTVHCKIKISNLLLQKQEFNPLCVARKLQVILNNGERRKLNPSDVQSFKILGSQDEVTEFRRLGNDRQHFYRVLAEGKINLYGFYSAHPYDQSPVLHLLALKSSGEYARIKPAEVKAQLGRLIADDADLYKKWMAGDVRDVCALETVQLYNSRARK